jgi:hypothetical protein
MARAADIAALEAAMWADLSDRLALGTIRSSYVEVSEQLARCELIGQRAAYVMKLSSSLASLSLKVAARAASQASAAAAEVVGWQRVLDAAAHEATRIAAEASHVAAAKAVSSVIHPTTTTDSTLDEARLRQAQDRIGAAEAKVLELHTREMAASADVNARHAEVSRLAHEAESLRASIEALRGEQSTAERALQERQRDSLVLRRDLELQLEGLKVDARAAKSHLESIRIDITEAEAARDALRSDSAAAESGARQQVLQQQQRHNARAVESEPASPNRVSVHRDSVHDERAHSGEYASAYRADPSAITRVESSSFGDTVRSQGSPTSFTNGATRSRRLPPQGEQTIESGLAALQSVREQLRDLRGQSSPRDLSPRSPRATTGSFSSPSFHADPSSLHRASTAVYPPARDNAGLIGAARLRTSASMILESTTAQGPSPWKQRLMKLQGDLRTLRSELGAPTATPASPHRSI